MKLTTKIFFNAGSYKMRVPKEIIEQLKIKNKEECSIDIVDSETFIVKKLSITEQILIETRNKKLNKG